MEWLKIFSDDYANAVTAVAALGALVTAVITLLFLRREYKAKYRPYVVPIATLGRVFTTENPPPFNIFVEPRNVGPHPCKVKLTNIELQVGDDVFPTPSQKGWTLIGNTSEGFTLHCGTVFSTGISGVQQGRFRSNRIELRFTVNAESADGEHPQVKPFAFEIDVRGAEPVIFARP